MNHRTPWQTEEYFKTFDISIQKINYDGIDFYYTIKGKTLEIYARLQNVSYISKGLVDKIFSECKCSRIIVRYLYFNDKKALERMNLRASLDDTVLNIKEYANYEQYLGNLGKKTRQHLRYYRRKLDLFLNEENKAMHCRIICREHRSEDVMSICERIYELNQQRCNIKGFNSGVDKRWLSLFAKNGIIIYYEEECNQECNIVAGTISFVDDDELYFMMIAHDKTYHEFNVGNLVLQDTIEWAFMNGIAKFHFLWGDSEYKRRFGGEKVELYNVLIYRYFLVYLFSKALFFVRDVLYIYVKKVLGVIKKDK